MPVTVAGVSETPEIAFEDQITPVLSRAGCNMGACHASQYGKGGFVLSVFAFEPDKDREAIVRDRQGRRVNFLDVDRSLFLLKPTMQVPHGGGKRLDKDSVDYQILAAWLKNGAPAPQKDAAKVTAIRVTPRRRICTPKDSQQLRVEATYSDGRTRDVTAWAKFDTLDDAVVQITPEGLASTSGRGQAAVMVRFMGQADMATFVVPFSESVELAGWKNQNFVDELASAKFQELGLEPSPLCDDATFLRRAFLDAIGSLPTPEQTREFIASNDPGKRDKIIDQLLGLTGDPSKDIYNDQYAATWTLKWSDLLGNKSQTLGEQGMWALHNWIKESFRTNRPFDEFVRELVTAKGFDLLQRPGELLPDQRQRERPRGIDGPTVFGRQAGVREVPSSSVREIQPRRLLRIRGVLLARRHQEQRRLRAVRAGIGRAREIFRQRPASADGESHGTHAARRRTAHA